MVAQAPKNSLLSADRQARERRAAADDFASPAIQPVNDTPGFVGGCADLPTERNQDSDGDQTASDNNGKR